MVTDAVASSIIFLPPLVLQMFMSEAGKISQKIKVWFSDYFNICDFLAIMTFFIGFGLRLAGGEAFTPGRIVYCLNIIFWYVRLMDILAVNQQAGPYVMMIAKMVRGRRRLQIFDASLDLTQYCLFELEQPGSANRSLMLRTSWLS